MDPGKVLLTPQHFMSLGFVWLDSGSQTGKESEIKFLCAWYSAWSFTFHI